MKKVSKQLMVLCISLAAVTLAMVVLYELDVLESGVLTDSKQTEFVAMSIMELTSLAAAFFGLRLSRPGCRFGVCRFFGVVRL